METKIKLGMVQINNSFSKQSYFPYSVGILQACLKEYLAEPERLEFLQPIYSRIPVESAVKNLLSADIVCFSVYIWNIKISLKIAEEVKKNKPNTLIIFGGPQVPSKEVESFLRLNHFIDIVCHGEGEAILPSILKKYDQHNWIEIPGISYIDLSGKFVQTAKCERISDLNKVSSPYLGGVFDSLIKENKQTKWVALWETNRGCPFSCAYCDWGSATKNKVYQRNLRELFKEIDWFSENKIEFIFCCDANFGIFDRDIEIVKYMAKNKRKYGYPKALSVQNTKNFTEESYQIYKSMSDSGLNKGVSLSLQSLNKETLRNIGRKNVPIEVFRKVQEKLTSFNTETFTDLILGLPGETYKSFADGVSTTVENGQHNRIQFNNLSILPNAQMGDFEYQKKFGFNIVETKIVNIHGALTSSEQIYERQQLVIGTNTMPKSDWVKARVFGWMMSLLHFNKLLQAPFIILNKAFSVSFRNLVEIFTETKDIPALLSEIRLFFINKATSIQDGGVEFCESKRWLNIWWPADELILIKLCTENKLSKFYKEAEYILSNYLKEQDITDYQTILKESIFLNQSLMKLPFQEQDQDIHLSCNIWDVWSAVLKGVNCDLRKGDHFYRIDRTTFKWSSWEDWCREVIWYGNKKGAYIYNCRAVDAVRELVR